MQQISRSEKHVLSSAKKNLESTQYKHRNKVHREKLESVLPVNFRGRITPINSTLQHPLAPLLIQHATQGCGVSCEPVWKKTDTSAAVNRGPHPSEKTSDAIMVLKN